MCEHCQHPPELFAPRRLQWAPDTRLGRGNIADNNDDDSSITVSEHSVDHEGGGGSAISGGEKPIEITYNQDGRETQLADVDSLGKRCGWSVFSHEAREALNAVRLKALVNAVVTE